MELRWTDRIWFIPSTSQLNTSYEVRRCSDGSFVCNCPDFLYSGNQCKHIRKVKMSLAGEKQKNKLPGLDKKMKICPICGKPQVVVNSNHPLAKGLVRVIVFDEPLRRYCTCEEFGACEELEEEDEQ